LQEVKIYNSLSKEKEIFKPLNASNIGIYVCGPTVYSEVHLGNCRTFISFDVVVRYLKFIGYNVRYVRNITDAGHLENDADEGEDKISKKARIEQVEPMEIVQKYTLNFHKVLNRFNTIDPSIEPTATGHIIEQIEMIKRIISNGFAYENNGSIYFDVKKYIESGNNYGVLSGRDIDELISGTRKLAGQVEKKNPYDFALWKKASSSHIMKWHSPWSEGFPGWHLECSAMGTKYLGTNFDIHGGGMDLKFPHHECEIAQGISANNVDPVKYWMHANMLTLNGKRMSKSTGNTLLPEEIFSGNNDILDKSYSPMVLRFFMLQTNYRSNLDFSSRALSAAEKGFNKLMYAKNILNKTTYIANNLDQNDEDLILKLCNKCYSCMNDDFNTSNTIATLFDIVSKINLLSQNANFGNLSEETFNKLKYTFNSFVEDVLGIEDETINTNKNTDKLIKLILEIRTNAKNNNDYKTADKIRDELMKLNIEIKDNKNETTYNIK